MFIIVVYPLFCLVIQTSSSVVSELKRPTVQAACIQAINLILVDLKFQTRHDFCGFEFFRDDDFSLIFAPIDESFNPYAQDFVGNEDLHCFKITSVLLTPVTE